MPIRLQILSMLTSLEMALKAFRSHMETDALLTAAIAFVSFLVAYVTAIVNYTDSSSTGISVLTGAICIAIAIIYWVFLLHRICFRWRQHIPGLRQTV
ncbi:hypothetical protein AALP_AAs67722U000100 [Arabis alpina]|uniref:Uncharacterized protein n=1 Tax=Arabis alpina TaxID=50452 RepID=A0A087G033_ARAAL|nr:hypothetical protein AALP_AAs67722U000100 [Arabis alpina]